MMMLSFGQILRHIHCIQSNMCSEKNRPRLINGTLFPQLDKKIQNKKAIVFYLTIST